MSKQLNEHELAAFAERYVAMWNEADNDLRHKLIHELWAGDGMQLLVDPPQAMREALAELAFPIPPVEVRGLAALERRVTRAYEMFVAPGHRFVARGAATRLSTDLIGLGWDMVATDGTVAGAGYDVIALDEQGRIRLDSQYIG
ncbi:hypothetical protein [Nocardia sp. XZ_19_385]|uniref:hypothetical protein n=1 Tax=Nocardia sp. XZ_19_385 TaxID=2769488 RepID=UPI00188EF38A|nr:hypothetical protein [Nocardia sp. XZ_19_385]